MFKMKLQKYNVIHEKSVEYNFDVNIRNCKTPVFIDVAKTF